MQEVSEAAVVVLVVACEVACEVLALVVAVALEEATWAEAAVVAAAGTFPVQRCTLTILVLRVELLAQVAAAALAVVEEAEAEVGLTVGTRAVRVGAALRLAVRRTSSLSLVSRSWSAT